ncbi:MAG: hypothetical protein K2I03_12330 [Lachnospiraceae bacterium]|nr:hypothetical protein [Lachnospiraceae bacterium]
MSLIFLILFILFLYKLPSLFRWFVKLVRCIYWVIKDIKLNIKLKKENKVVFNRYGLIMFVGRQGEGKTVSLVNYCKELKEQFPNLKIYSNFDLSFADGKIQTLNDLLLIRNGEDGVLFAIDELQNEFSSTLSKSFPENLLSTITMQRKQRIQIATTTQVFTRVAKPLREQCFEVVECRTFFNRWTRNKCYDAIDYNTVTESRNPEAKLKLLKKWKLSFIQTDDLRNCYDTYEVVQRISRQGFAEKL